MKKRFIKSFLVIMVLTCTYAVQARQSEKSDPKRINVFEALVSTLPNQPHNPEIIHLEPEHVKIHTSFFSKVEVIDNRFDTAVIGFVRMGQDLRSNVFIKAPSQSLR